MRNPAPKRETMKSRTAKADAAALARQGQADPVLIELVKFLARTAAERDYEEHTRNRQKHRQRDTHAGAVTIPGDAP